MTTLRERLLKRLEFDEKASWYEQGYDSDYEPAVPHIINGARWQHERLKPIMMAMLECVDAFSTWKLQVDAHGGDYLPGNYRQISQALAALEKELGEG